MCAGATCWAMHLWAQCALAQRATGQCICGCTPGRIPAAVRGSSPPLVATAYACAQPWLQQQQQQQQKTAAAATPEDEVSASVCSEKRGAMETTASAAHGKRGQQNILGAGSEGKGVVWVSEWPDNSAMERSPKSVLLSSSSASSLLSPEVAVSQACSLPNDVYP
eukprot:352297-Chlamydomonas_euryale.AAC.3